MRRATIIVMAIAVVATIAGVGSPTALADTSYSSVVLADSPSAYWRLGEAPGATTAADASGNGYSLNYSGLPTLGVEGAIDDGGSDTAMGVNSTTAGASGGTWPTPVTVELWVQTAQPVGSSGASLVRAGDRWATHWNLDIDGQGNLTATFLAALLQQ